VTADHLTVDHLPLKKIISLFRRITIDPTISWNGTPCWVWTGETLRDFYGRVSYKGQNTLTHRLFYAWAIGPVPSHIETGLTIDHLCRNRSCCNPVHLDLVSHTVNCFRARQRFCPEGHEIVGDNAYVVPCRPNSSPQCVICKRATLRRVYHTKKTDPAFKEHEKKRRHEKYLKYGY